MRTTNFKGSPLAITGKELSIGDSLPTVTLTTPDMADLKTDSFKNKVVVVLSVPSLDTPVCSIEAKRFNDEITKLSNDVVALVVSRDLPFAQKRWCGAEGVERALTASDYKHRTFGEAFGTTIPDWGLLSRAVFVAGKDGKISYVEYVPEIASEPNYDAAVGAIKQKL